MTVGMPLRWALHSRADQREDALATKELQTLRWSALVGTQRRQKAHRDERPDLVERVWQQTCRRLTFGRPLNDDASDR
jgi:hypothetical protein